MGTVRAEEWDRRYQDGQQWSAGPNQLVAELLTGLGPGRAVDLRRGRGGTRCGWPTAAGTSPPSTSPRPGWPVGRPDPMAGGCAG
jgi:hypothetical protein